MNLREYLREQLNLPLLSRLGASVGLKAIQAVPIAAQVLPAQLATLQALAGTPDGAQRLLDLARDRVAAGTVGQLTASPQEVERLQQVGAGLLPEIMGTFLNTEVARVAAGSRASEVHVRQMMELLLPLLLTLIARRAASEQLTSDTLGTLFGGTVLGATATVVESAALKPGVVIEQGAPVRAAPATRPTPPVQPLQQEPRRQGLGWLWLLPLFLLLLLGGCFLLRGKSVAGLNLTSPTSAAQVDRTGPVTYALNESGHSVVAQKITLNGLK
jgi:hypothetical protein